MECPRCDRPLVRYVLGGREAVVCESCGYIGVPVEHRGEHADVESWDDAITRFDAVGSAEAGSVEVTDDGPEVPAAGGDEDAPEPTVVRIADADDPAEFTGGDGEGGGDGASEEAAICERCGKRFDSQAQLNGHMAVHADGDE